MEDEDGAAEVLCEYIPDKEEDIDPEVTEAPFDAQMILSGNGIDGEVLGEMLSGEDMENGAALPDENIPGQYGMENYIPMPEEVGQAMGMTPAMSQNGGVAQQNRQSQPQQNQQQSNQPQPKPAQTPAAKAAPQSGRQAANNAPTGKNTQSATGIKKDMPVEQIYSMLDRDSAAAVVIPMGYNKGKTLGQVAVEKPANLQWYVDSYGGPDNLLRAAAKFLIDMALGQAS